MSNFRPIDRDTAFLFPPSVDEWLPQRHLARYVVEVVEGLDLSEMVKAYRGSGSASYHPAMLLALLIYACATKVFSSRAIERATYDSVAFRFIAANEHPDHDTIATFRKRFLPQIETLFVEVLKLARTMGMLKMGTVALDGTKIHANASRHSALSYGHAKKLEKQLRREVQQLLKLAEQADAADIPDGMSIPEELERRETRLAAIAEAKQKIEARVKEEQDADYQQKLAARAEQEKRTGKKPPGPPPAPPSGTVDDKEQINLTDEDSRIMKVAGGGFDQCYNAQAAVAAGSMLICRAGRSPFRTLGEGRCIVRFQALRDLISATGGRRFLITVGAGLVNSVLVTHGFITSADFVEVTKWTVSVFIAGNTIQKVSMISPNNRAAALDSPRCQDSCRL